jgi:vacuolar-type H+-ATPase subunit H
MNIKKILLGGVLATSLIAPTINALAETSQVDCNKITPRPAICDPKPTPVNPTTPLPSTNPIDLDNPAVIPEFNLGRGPNSPSALLSARITKIKGNVSVYRKGNSNAMNIVNSGFQLGDAYYVAKGGEMEYELPNGMKGYFFSNGDYDNAIKIGRPKKNFVEHGVTYIDLKAEAVIINNSNSSTPKYIKIGTPSVEIEPDGTIFLVSYDKITGSTITAVLEGSVRVTPTDTLIKPVVVSANEELTLTKGQASTSAKDRFGRPLNRPVLKPIPLSATSRKLLEEETSTTPTISTPDNLPLKGAVKSQVVIAGENLQGVVHIGFYKPGTNDQLWAINRNLSVASDGNSVSFTPSASNVHYQPDKFAPGSYDIRVSNSKERSNPIKFILTTQTLTAADKIVVDAKEAAEKLVADAKVVAEKLVAAAKLTSDAKIASDKILSDAKLAASRIEANAKLATDAQVAVDKIESAKATAAKLVADAEVAAKKLLDEAKVTSDKLLFPNPTPIKLFRNQDSKSNSAGVRFINWFFGI